MHAIADAVTQCKFEATDPAADEVVLYKILQVCRVCYAKLCLWLCKCPQLVGCSVSANARQQERMHAASFTD
jgi:hypothetical protein